MSLIGVIAQKKDFQVIRKEIAKENIEAIEITKESIVNLKNVKFEEIIILEDITLELEEYKYIGEKIEEVKYLIVNSDIKINLLRKININKPVKIITFGFNTKATISISSVKEDKIIVCLQRNIKKSDNKILESQEKEIKVSNKNNKKIYNDLAIFIIKQLHNL